MPRPKPNYDFEIHVDPSCLSAPMDDEDSRSIPGDVVEQTSSDDHQDNSVAPVAASVEDASAESSILSQEPDEPSMVESSRDDPVDTSVLSQEDGEDEETPTIESVEQGEAENSVLSQDAEEPSIVESRDDETAESSILSHDAEEPSIVESQGDQAADSSILSHEGEEPSFTESHDEDKSLLETDGGGSVAEEEQHEVQDDSLLSEATAESAHEESQVQESIEHDESTAEPVSQAVSRPQSAASSQKERTEDLISEAARNIIAHIDQHYASSNQSDTASDAQASRRESAESTHKQFEDPFVESTETEDHDTRSQHSRARSSGDEAADSSSQHEGTDEDVFSHRSGRSSIGSCDAGSESGKPLDYPDNMTTSTRSPRVSDISHYDRQEFTPMARSTPRPPFRTPSDVRELQMSSPTPSLYGSPRSSKRQYPTVSRLGTPTAQYSSKKNSTPPRFKVRQEAPLVLLHATLLPLRWIWGDLVNSLETTELSDQAKSLRDNWRLLQDRLGDTVAERGILLSHPQSDYEILEERIQEALDLPLRRRARILECGHYLGPSNEHTLAEDEESEDEYAFEDRKSFSSVMKRHWCATCKSEIRYDALGTDKIFRVKVFASNGLMRAGAWAACWKEMERVDVEIEPIVESAVRDELVHLADTEEERELARREEEQIAQEVAHQYEQQKAAEAEAERRRLEESQRQPPQLTEPPRRLLLEQAHSRPASTEPSHRQPLDASSYTHPGPEASYAPSFEERARQDEERMREVYGMPVPSPEPSHQAPPRSSYSGGEAAREPSRAPSPRPQSQAHYHHRESYTHHHHDPSAHPSSQPQGGFPEQRQDVGRGDHAGPGPYQGASLPELLLESVKVLMRDTKNVVIVMLSVFVLLLALRSARSSVPPLMPASQVVYHAAHQGAEHAAMGLPKVEEPVSPPPVIGNSAAAAPADADADAEILTEREVVRIVQTVTETQTEVEKVMTATAASSQVTEPSAVPLETEEVDAAEEDVMELEAAAQLVEEEKEEEAEEEVKEEAAAEKISPPGFSQLPDLALSAFAMDGMSPVGGGEEGLEGLSDSFDW